MWDLEENHMTDKMFSLAHKIRSKIEITMKNSTTKLFIPLKKEYFQAFASGEKTEEYRPLGPRWNEKTCAIGRPAVISNGYGKWDRLYGMVKSFRVENNPSKIRGWIECYGDRACSAACIGIQLT